MTLFKKVGERKKENITSINHIGFIMDGNGRWALKRGLTRSIGHEKGCEKIKEIALSCLEKNIKVMSTFCFSTENWKRDKHEIDYLFSLLGKFLQKEINELLKKGIKITTLGDLSKLPSSTQNIILKCKELTKNNNKFTLNICLNYGGKAEIVEGVNKLIKDIRLAKIKQQEIDESLFESYLESKDLPPLDVVVRTSGEQRVSNFMLWKLSYAEFIFVKENWPDFSSVSLDNVIKEYDSRDRRYGGINYGSK